MRSIREIHEEFRREGLINSGKWQVTDSNSSELAFHETTLLVRQSPALPFALGLLCC